MHPKRLLPDSRNVGIGGGLLLALALAAILAPVAQADLIVPAPPKPTVPTAVTPPPAPSPSAAPLSPSSAGSTGEPGRGAAPNPASGHSTSNGLPAAPNGPENEPDLPDLPEIGQGCDIGCLEGWAADAHAWILAYGLTPLSRYNSADFQMLQGIVTDLAEINEEITTALTATRTTLTDAITDGFDGSGICSHDDTPEGDVVLCPN